MQSSHQNLEEREPSRASNSVTASLLLSLATPPILLVLVGQRAITNFMLEISRASEEIFRGDRLPVLDPPTSQQDQQQ